MRSFIHIFCLVSVWAYTHFKMHYLSLLCLLSLTYGLPGLADLPAHRVLWGEKGPPGRHFRRQAESSTSAESTTTRVADSACTNSPDSRNCWSSGYSVATDFDVKSPPGGQVVSVSIHNTSQLASSAGCWWNKVYPEHTEHNVQPWRGRGAYLLAYQWSIPWSDDWS